MSVVAAVASLSARSVAEVSSRAAAGAGSSGAGCSIAASATGKLLASEPAPEILDIRGDSAAVRPMPSGASSDA
jgi:hypothetical protein